MKWEIFHSTRYDYESAVRDSVNNVCLQPMPIPEQTVELFILKVLPASRLTHSMIYFPTGSAVLKSPNRTVPC